VHGKAINDIQNGEAMAKILMDSRVYETVMGSDLINDGMFLELNDLTDGGHETILYAFFSDIDSKFTFWAYKNELPFDLVETFVSEARKRLPPKSGVILNNSNPD
jgi:hypothetical protein